MSDNLHQQRNWAEESFLSSLEQLRRHLDAQEECQALNTQEGENSLDQALESAVADIDAFLGESEADFEAPEE